MLKGGGQADPYSLLILVDLSAVTSKSLTRLRRDDLVRLCEARDLDASGKKAQLARALVKWRDQRMTLPRGVKRKRDDIFQQLLDEEPVPAPTSKSGGESTSRASTTSPRLPPISTLLRQQNGTSSDSLPSPDQLPSPPTTTEFRPRSDYLEHSYSTRLPALSLPSPRNDKSQPSSQDDESACKLLVRR